MKQISILEDLMKDDYTDTYDDTEERLESIQKVVKRYRPEALKDVFAYIGST